jgi:hypothetical protein
MSSPINAVYTGTFVAPAAGSYTLSLPASATEIEVVNLTALNAGGAALLKSEGFASANASTAITYTGGGGVAAIAANGFTFFDDSGNVPNSASTALNGAFLTRANPALAATGDTATASLVSGDVVRMYGTTGMLQIAGMDFTVGTVVANTSFTLAYLNNAGFAADATAGQWIKLPFRGVPLSSGQIAPDPRFYPRNRYITAITAANPAVVTLSVAHSYTPGEKVRIILPKEFTGGVTSALNNALATITAVNYTTNTITLDLSGVGTAFAFPTSATAAAGVSFPQIVPVGEAAINTIALPVGNSLSDATRNTSIRGVVVGSGCMVAGSTHQWIAKKGLSM